MASKLPLEKLKLLYLMQQANTAVTDEELLSECDPWLPYFELQTTLHALLSQHMITLHPSLYENKRYALAPFGAETLSHFAREIPLSQRKRLDVVAISLREKARTASTYVANYHKIGPDQYLAQLQVLEQDMILLNVTVNLPTLRQAHVVCENWSENASDVYAAILRMPHKEADPQEGTGENEAPSIKP